MSDGAPLTVVATEGDRAILEDSRGISFTVPMSWVPPELAKKWTSSPDTNNEGDAGFRLNHTDLNAPPGELEKVWKQAATEGYYEQHPEENGGFGSDTITSALDDWNAGRPGTNIPQMPGVAMPDQGSYVRGGIPTRAERAALASPFPSPATAAATFQASRRQLQRQNPTNAVPANAGTGWGNWDQVWDSTKKRWIKSQ